jgi:hypothetical protein
MGALQKVFPLIVLFIILGVLAFIGFVVYSIVMEVQSHAKNKMEKKNVVFSKDGMKVGVKEVKAEDYADKTQRYIQVPAIVAMRCWEHGWR